MTTKPKPGRPELPASERAEKYCLRFPPAVMLKMQAKAIEEGFVTANGGPKVAALIRHHLGI